MGTRFMPYLEYDGENPDRNDFICYLNDGICYPYVKKWEGLYTSDMSVSCCKKHSLEVEKDVKDEDSSWSLHSWGLNKIFSQINLMKKEWNLGEEVQYIDEDDENEFKSIGYDFGLLHVVNIICDLQWLYDLSMEKCTELNLNPEKCYVVWWINY
jgi:hypothetical protein